MRGEQVGPLRVTTADRGPTPHARGAVIGNVGKIVGEGTNPACAGSSNGQCFAATHAGDQPRMRGEQGRAVRDATGELGPTPHARGAVPHTTLVGEPTGTNPACAGSSPLERRGAEPPGDQPRMRGEQRDNVAALYSGTGPTPHARGAGGRRRPSGWCRGTNPACAGSSGGSIPTATRTGDQPRMRGEQAVRQAGYSAATGPTPHARGADQQDGEDGAARGTNPACAGSSTRAGVR